MMTRTEYIWQIGDYVRCATPDRAGRLVEWDMYRVVGEVHSAESDRQLAVKVRRMKFGSGGREMTGVAIMAAPWRFVPIHVQW